MAEMKDSGIEWIGEIPTDWDTKAIRFLILEHFSGAWGNDEKTDSDNNRICMRIADFDYFRMQFKENVEYTIRNYTNTEIANKTLRYGDLLIEKSGGGEKTPVGRTVVYRLNNNALFANFMDCIRLKENEYNYEFAKYVFYSLYNNGITNLYYNKTTGIQNLSMQKYLREVKLPFPTLIEQGKIADFLDEKCAEVDALHTDIEKQIETLEEYKKSIITEAVTKGLDPDVEMEDSGIEWIGMIPKDWSTIRIGHVFSLRNERNSLPEDQVQLLSLYTGIGVFPQGEHVTASGNHAQTVDGYKIVHKNDIVVNIILAWMGAIGVSDYDGVTSPAYDIYIPDLSKVVPHYFHYVFRTAGIAGECYKYGRGIMMMRWRTYSQEFKQIFVPFPSLEKQQEIAEYLDKKCAEIDGAIEEKKQQLETLEQYKKSLIYEYVTGKKEVK